MRNEFNIFIVKLFFFWIEFYPQILYFSITTNSTLFQKSRTFLFDENTKLFFVKSLKIFFLLNYDCLKTNKTMTLHKSKIFRFRKLEFREVVKSFYK